MELHISAPELLERSGLFLSCVRQLELQATDLGSILCPAVCGLCTHAQGIRHIIPNLADLVSKIRILQLSGQFIELSAQIIQQ